MASDKSENIIKEKYRETVAVGSIYSFMSPYFDRCEIYQISIPTFQRGTAFVKRVYL